VRTDDLVPIVRDNIARETAIMSDEAGVYCELGNELASDDTVVHRDEKYVRREGDKIVTANKVEGYFSIFERGTALQRETSASLSCGI
jgi:hypothetical protein